jgi:hypothetical protein
MRTKNLLFLFAAMLLFSAACDNATDCLSRQKRGFVSSGSGYVEADQSVSVLVSYDTQGTQNDVVFSWQNKGTVAGPLPQVYATSSDCKTFVPNNEVCKSIGLRQGGVGPNGEPIIDHITISTEDLLGAMQYRLQIIGDSTKATDYTYNITWFSGPDC